MKKKRPQNNKIKNNTNNNANKNIKITPAAIIASLMGFGLIGLGLHEAIINGKNGAYYMVFLGVLFLGGIGTAFLKK